MQSASDLLYDSDIGPARGRGAPAVSSGQLRTVAETPAPRRIVDDRGLSWRVHELAPRPERQAWREIGLLFCCDAPGAIPQVRRAPHHLECLDQGELLDLLLRADD